MEERVHAFGQTCKDRSGPCTRVFTIFILSSIIFIINVLKMQRNQQTSRFITHFDQVDAHSILITSSYYCETSETLTEKKEISVI
jgi:hypothetical protein